MATATTDYRLTDEQRAVVEANVGLVYGFVHRRYGGKHPKYDDLIQAGVLGLMRAAQKYDPAKAKFSTYANFWIRNLVARYLDEDTTIRVPHHVVCDARARRGKFVEEAEAARRVEKFDAGGDGFHPVGGDDPARAVEADDEFWNLRRALSRLPERQREVVLRRAAGEQYKVIGESLGVCRERPRQIEREALDRLRCEMGVTT